MYSITPDAKVLAASGEIEKYVREKPFRGSIKDVQVIVNEKHGRIQVTIRDSGESFLVYEGYPTDSIDLAGLFKKVSEGITKKCPHLLPR